LFDVFHTNITAYVYTVVLCFTQAYVGCTWGIEKIGYVIMAGKAANSFGSVFSGKLVKFTGRVPVFVGAFCINVSAIFYMLLWEPSTDRIYVLFVMAILWMLADSVWQTQINGECFVQYGPYITSDDYF
jgi:hypothetical protein